MIDTTLPSGSVVSTAVTVTAQGPVTPISMPDILRLSDVPSDDKIIDAYLFLVGTGPSTTAVSWPHDALRLLVLKAPKRAWHLLSRLISAVPDSALPDLGALHLENFVNDHATAFISEIEQQARQDPKFLRALSNVWVTRGTLPEDVEMRLQRATNGAILLDEA